MQRLIAEKTPDQLKLQFALWTREAVGKLIKERYGVVYAMQSLSDRAQNAGGSLLSDP